MDGNPPNGIVFPIDDVELRLDPGPHPIEAAHGEAIASNWKIEKAANPAIFDGAVIMLSALSFDHGRLAGRCHATGFSTYMFWRKDRSIAHIRHIFANAALISADGALIAARMAAHTVNAGRVYFAAGSLDPDDAVNGKVDLHRNMAREVREETGLDLEGLRRDDGYFGYTSETGTVIFRRYWLPETADEIARRISAFITADPEPEITEPVVIRSAEDRPTGLMPHMDAIIDWHFGGQAPD